MSEPTVLSVIVPVYNLEAFLPEALDSLLKIDFTEPYEIIVVDDGSSDGSLAVLRAYEERCDALRVITGPNGGVSRARNAGIEAARGKYLTFLDGDDTVAPGFFSAAVREIEENGYDLVQGNARFMDGNRELKVHPGSSLIPGGRLVSADPEEQMEWFFGRNEILMICVWGKVYRREIIGDIRFEPGIRIAEDQKFVFDVLRKNPKVLVLDETACNYTVRESSALNSGYSEKGPDALKVLEDCERAVDSPAILSHIAKRKTDVLIRIYNTTKLKGGDTEKTLEAIRKTDLSGLRGEFTKKEWVKLKMLQRCPWLYDTLLKVLKI